MKCLVDESQKAITVIQNPEDLDHIELAILNKFKIFFPTIYQSLKWGYFLVSCLLGCKSYYYVPHYSSVYHKVTTLFVCCFTF